MSELLDALDYALKYRFQDERLAIQALTHPSFDHEQGETGQGSYQRLEFLGDAVLGMLLAEMLFMRFAEWNEGDLSRLRSQMADQTSLASIAKRLELGPLINLGRGEEQSAGREKDSILADVLEALIGAMYLDGGIEQVHGLVGRLFSDHLEAPGRPSWRLNDPKSELQELLSARQLAPPLYQLVEESGPPHERSFKFQVLSDAQVIGEGSGRSKKQAQQAAAAEALVRISSVQGADT